MSSLQAKTLIVDDELNAAQLLKNLIEPFPVFNPVSLYSNASVAYVQILEQKPAFLFLDIQMPGLSGLQLAEKIKPHLPETKIIYVTAYDQYALEALRQNAFDYLLKPICKSDLIRVVDKLMVEKSAKNNTQVNSHLLVHGLEGIHHVTFDDIVFFEAEGSYTHVVLKSDKRILSTINLGKMIPSLPEGKFIRISRKHMINLNYFTFFNSKGKLVKIEACDKEYWLEVTIKLNELKQMLGA